MIFYIFLLVVTSSEAAPINPRKQPELVTDLLSALFRQTIYNRIENLLLDPGRLTGTQADQSGDNRQQLIQSAVDNYHKQKMVLPDFLQDYPSQDEVETDEDLTDMAGKKIHHFSKNFVEFLLIF